MAHFKQILTNSRLHRWIIFPLISLIISGCIKEEFSIDKLDTSLDINPAVATPIGYFDFTMDRVIDTSENVRITITPEKIISLNYVDEVYSDFAGDLFSLTPVIEEISIPNPTGEIIDLFEGAYQTEYSAYIPLFLSNTGGLAELDSIVLSSARVILSGIEFPGDAGEAHINIPGLKRENSSFSRVITPDTEDQVYSLNDYTLELTEHEQEFNRIKVDIKLFFAEQPKILFASRPLLNLKMNISLDEWAEIYGYLGQETIDLITASFYTNFDENFPEGRFYFQDPRLTFRTTNSFGVPMAMSIFPIFADTRDAGEIVLKGPGVPEPPDYFYPAWPLPGSPQTEAIDSLLITGENSNLRDLISSRPQIINYNVAFSTNPGDEKKQNVIFNDSRFITRVELQLPFYGKAESLAIKDTLAVNFSDFDIPGEDLVEQILFKLYYENSYPADILIQLYLADENYQVTDKLFNDFSLIKAASPTEEYTENPQYVSGELESTLPGNYFNNVRNARYILGEAYLTTVDNRDDIKIFENQRLFLRLGVVFDISASIDDF